MTTMLLYKDIKALNRDEHKALRLKPVENCEFAAGAHLVPLAGLEFFQAARHYPIVFIGEGEQATPIALLGLQDGHNAFLDDGQKWLANTYVPAFVRRYPFVLAQDDAQNLTVCIDAAYPGWNQEEGRELFTGEGGNSGYLEEMIQFLQNFTAEMQRTRELVTTLNDLQLLSPRSLQLAHGSGETFVLRDFLMIDEEKFAALSDEQVLALHRKGFLGWIYAHLMSLGNANQLFERFLSERRDQPAEQA
ncbi:SapC family protein [Pseudomonas sp. LS44]|uniref:SapC family protein n=1 Tax=Pseudomonas sp. LS44 TaxID=1357074 RepID=UPI00215AFAF8|nr:SapC family protein [Pseudomonas sp. LS44]UVE18468.1 SapC family protein [Pseudomonas sp. LS44]